MNTHAVLGLALAAGLVAALNPCGFAFLPGCLGLVIAGSSQDVGRRTAVARAAAATVAMAAGFVTVFGLFGLVISPLLASAQKYLPYATLVIGVLLIATGVWLLLGNDIAVMLPRPGGGAPTAQLGSMYGYGVGYATASLSCTAGPFLALIGATFQKGSWLTGVLAFLVYAGGMAITVGALALAVALLGSSVAGRIRGLLPHITRIAGAVVLLTGLYVTYYGYYERQLFFSHGSPRDPVVERAASVQMWLQSHVGELGPWPFVWVIAVVVVIAVLPAGVRRLRGRRG
ncbi:cytochrome c biogenesis protein transmembrane region [Segniliparus rotundus DSM 44985]|uniref:Cytochrome c biogenesis protein transmembrane region n=1 Tax=Segniliparus rotundus (strain ATCC BAA-972 / CDC 1076 / CIP 108378 / DSM 44985 / JCM 13578) TaxID=640132 RepID=D6Z8R1_SEGRD|nr:cytochrome c biogenesis protein CcdA [Segniliparus rotundus]ADG98341.1 cytochrome c biogenesis protein transmembrane region [Segniliparus rotundus DSM 44985]